MALLVSLLLCKFNQPCFIPWFYSANSVNCLVKQAACKSVIISNASSTCMEIQRITSFIKVGTSGQIIQYSTKLLFQVTETEIRSFRDVTAAEPKEKLLRKKIQIATEESDCNTRMAWMHVDSTPQGRLCASLRGFRSTFTADCCR